MHKNSENANTQGESTHDGANNGKEKENRYANDHVWQQLR